MQIPCHVICYERNVTHVPQLFTVILPLPARENHHRSEYYDQFWMRGAKKSMFIA